MQTHKYFIDLSTKKTLLAFILCILAASSLLSACSQAVAADQYPVGSLEEPLSDEALSVTPDEDAFRWMTLLLDGPDTDARQATESILAVGDSRFIAVFIELLRASQIGLTTGTGYQDSIQALEILSGEKFGGDWPAWVDWYGSTDLLPPPGFTGWKGRLLSQIDPGFGDFLYDGAPSNLRVEEIQWGGVHVDGIPALDNAAMIPAIQAGYLEPDEPVFGISINGDSRAYPLRILDWHEMANDVVGRVPLSLAYCTLCGAGIAFDGRGSDGTTYTFGSSGFLFRSNKLMYDRQTRTLWNQLSGEPVLGELVGSGIKLDLLPVVVTTWEAWLVQHPDTVVLDKVTGYSRPYYPGAAYGDYFSDADTMFPVWQRNDLLHAKDRVYALQIEGIPIAYPLENLAAEGVVNDTVGDTPIVLVASRGDITVEGTNQRVGAVKYNAGGEVRAYDRGSETFTIGSDPDTLIDSTGTAWQVTEEALVGPDGARAPRLNGHLAYWFGWYAFFPNTLIYSGP